MNPKREKLNARIDALSDSYEELTQNKNSSKNCINTNSKFQILTSDHTGITLIALIITIIIMLILVAVTVTIALNGRLFKTAQQSARETQNKIDEELELSKGKVEIGGEVYGLINDYILDWSQDKTEVTKGSITLKVGQAVTGYTGNGKGDNNWYVLGAEDGKLLITTKTNQGIVSLSGQDGYAKGVEKLNEEAAKYKDNKMAESARSINVEDMNRVTGYDPDVAKYKVGTSNVNQWKNEVTYELSSSDSKIHYTGTKYPTVKTSSSNSSFTYWTGIEWKTLGSGESAKLTHNYYYYYPQTLTTTSSTDTKIHNLEDSKEAYDLLFSNTNSPTTCYWLGSQYVGTNLGNCSFGMRYVDYGYVRGLTLYNSQGNTYTYSNGVRPVVCLKSNVKVTNEGTLSL